MPTSRMRWRLVSTCRFSPTRPCSANTTFFSSRDRKKLLPRDGRDRCRLGLDAERARERAHHAIDRRAFLRAAGEIDAAQQAALLEVAAAVEDHLEKAAEQTLQAGELLREREDRGPLQGVALDLDLVDQAIAQARLERREFAAELLHRRVVAARIVRKAEAPDLVALFLAELAEGLVEARDQVALRHHHVDRRTHAEVGVQLLQAQAQLRRVLLAVGRRLLQQVLDVDGQQHAVDRTTRPGLLQQAEKLLPGRPHRPARPTAAACSGRRCRSAPPRR